MKVLIATDSFKGSLSSLEAGKAISEGIRKASPLSEIEIIPVADGGEGTAKALLSLEGSREETVFVSDPLKRRVKAAYTVLSDGTAVIEISSAAGITLLGTNELDAMSATTYGVGEMIADAINKGCRNFIIGLGGSATNDGGTGMLQALGFGLRDSLGKDIPSGAQGLKYLSSITLENVCPSLKECSFSIACDVSNPLYGKNGCSMIFSLQKGADISSAKEMDSLLELYARKVKEVFPDSDPHFPGAGAAGGLGFAFMSFLGGRLTSGIDLVLDALSAEELVKEADITVTGEGRIDSQTVMGKAPKGIADRAKKYGKPVIAFCGSVSEDISLCNEKGIDAVFPVLRRVSSLDEAMQTENAYNNLRDTAEQVFRLIDIIKEQ